LIFKKVKKNRNGGVLTAQAAQDASRAFDRFDVDRNGKLNAYEVSDAVNFAER
jgi:hypothetical protein